MDTTTSKLTIFYDKQFWVGMYERTCDGKYSVARIVFGAEPKEYDVYAYMMQNFCKLRFSPAEKTTSCTQTNINPKRMQRQIKKQLQNNGTGTKSMQAVKLMQEQNKQNRKVHNKLKKEERKQLQFDLRVEKKKQKHKGH